ncbi:MAG TPA: T9SS type A sorting domain-containing protein [Adhaeribacter sp.]|nr:T9SS type A sorting domain-containing protein [Adhaeribacter sp.]
MATFFSGNLFAQVAPVKHWDKTFGGSSNDELRSLKQTADGGYILAGSSHSGNSGDKSEPNRHPFNSNTADYWVVKLDATGNKIWDKTFGGDAHDALSAMQQTSDGGYILAGSSSSGLTGDRSQANNGLVDFWILKLDSAGTKQWDQAFGGSQTNRATSIQQTADGGYIIGGSSNSGVSGHKSQPNLGSDDYWIVKTDAAGNKLWDKTFGTSSKETLNSIYQTSDGGYILAGTSEGSIGGDKTGASRGGADYWVVKTDANGLKQWDKTFGGNGADEAFSICQTSDGGYLLGGSSASSILSGDKSQPSKGGFDYWVIKLAANGNLIWDRSFGGAGNDRLLSLQQTRSGNFILGGYSDSGTSSNKTQPRIGSVDYWVIELNSIGNQLWDMTLGGTSQNALWEIRQTSDSGFILGGYSNSGISGDKSQATKGGYDYWIVKLGFGALGKPEEIFTGNLTLFPNPSHGKFNLQLTGLTAPTAEVTVTDLLGRAVLQQQFKTTQAQLSEEITLPAAATGMYLLQVKTGGKITSRKIVVE